MLESLTTLPLRRLSRMDLGDFELQMWRIKHRQPLRNFHEHLKYAESYNESERYWVKLQKWLEEQGYMLRPRFREGWIPSWKSGAKHASNPEDAVVHESATVMDATRISDGAFVMLKALSEAYNPYEIEIAQYLSSEPRASDPQNHCVPIYDLLPVPEELQLPGEVEEVIMVMPLLRKYDSPRFRTFGESVDFFSQIFEGLQFLHRLNIAHRDCDWLSGNVLMDARPLYPNSWHPTSITWRRDHTGKAKHFNRTDKPVKYYFCGLSISRHYRLEERPPMEAIIKGPRRRAPEFRNPGARGCDPFPTDVYFLGSVIWHFTYEKAGFEFMESLVADMREEDPAKRPTMDEVVTRFETILKSQPPLKLRSRVHSSCESAIMASFRIAPHWLRRIQYTIRHVPALPCRAEQS